MSDERLDHLRKQLKSRHGGDQTWDDVAEGSPYTGEYLRQIAAGDKSPPEKTVTFLLRWLDQPAQEHRVERVDRLQAWLRWLHDLLGVGMLPRIEWGGMEGRSEVDLQRLVTLLRRADDGLDSGSDQ